MIWWKREYYKKGDRSDEEEVVWLRCLDEFCRITTENTGKEERSGFGSRRRRKNNGREEECGRMLLQGRGEMEEERREKGGKPVRQGFAATL